MALPSSYTLFDTKRGDILLDAAAITAILAGGAGGDVPVGDLILAEGKVIIGSAGGVGAAQSLSGDVTMGTSGVTAIGAAKVTNAMLASGAGVGALLTAGLGASASYLKTASDAQTLLASDAGDRSVLIVVVVDEVFADGDGGQTTFTIGQTGTADKFAAAAAFTDAAAGAVFTFAGTLTGAANLIVTGGAATGTGTGGISVTVLALPAA